MLTLKSLTIKRNIPDSMDLVWVFEDTLEDLSDYVIDVYRSEAHSADLTEYEKVGEAIATDLFFFEDVSLKNLQHGTRTWYYKLNIKNTSTEVESLQPSEPAYVNDVAPNLKYSKILKIKQLGLKSKYAGREFHLLKRRTWGQRCDVSWDPVLFHKNSDICEDCNCWGTGWREGYFKPIAIRGQINAAPKIHDITPWGTFFPSDAILYILNKPPLTPQDIIVDNNNVRYRIERVRSIELLGVPIEQQAQLSRIHPDDEIYEYKIEDE